MSSTRTKLNVAIGLAVLVGVLYIPAFLHTRELASLERQRGISDVLPVYGSDSSGFVTLTNNLMTRGYFSGDLRTPETFRTPGYPFILALWKIAFGSYDFYPLLQVVLLYATAILIFFIGAALFSIPVGVVAASIFALDPNILFHSLVILSEIPHVFLLVLGTYLLLVPQKRWIPAEFSAGVVFGIATLIKPVSLYLPAVFVLYFILRAWRQGRIGWARHATLTSLLFILAYGAVLMPWMLRNERLVGVFGLSSVSAFNLFHYTVPEFLAFRDHLTPDGERVRLQKEIPAIPSGQYGNLVYSSTLDRVAVRYILTDPLRFTGFYAVKSIPFFLSSSLDNVFIVYNDVRGQTIFHPSTANLTNFILARDFRSLFRDLWSHPATTAEQILLGLAFCFSLLALFYRHRRLEVIILLLTVGYFATVTGVVAYARLRVPASPFLFILAVAGFSASMRLLWQKNLQGEPPHEHSPLLYLPTTNQKLLKSSSKRSLPQSSQKISAEKSL